MHRGRIVHLRVAATGRKRAAWTLSRHFWQSKNFQAFRVAAASALAKTSFLSESPPPIRAPISLRRDAVAVR
jgi:hypothetical protein